MSGKPSAEHVVETVVAALEPIPAVEAVALSGSLADGEVDEFSDVDVTAFCDGALPDEAARAGVADAAGAEFVAAFEWPHGASGAGVVLDYEGVKVDALFCVTAELAERLEALADGEVPAPAWAPHEAAFGQYDSIHANAVQDCEIRHDPTGRLRDLKRIVAEYPEAYGEAVIDVHLDAAASLHERKLAKAASRGDFLHFDACAQRCVRSLVLVAFALNGEFYPGGKKNRRRLESFDALPDGFLDRIDRVRRTPSTDVAAMETQAEVLGSLVEDTARFVEA